MSFRPGLDGVSASKAAALAFALALAACQEPTETTEPAPARQANANRDAELAAEQLAGLGGAASAETRALYTGEFLASGSLDGLTPGEGAVEGAEGPGEGSGEGSGEGAWELRLLEDYGLFSRPGLSQDGGLPSERQYRERGMQVAVGPVTVTLRAEACPLPSGESLPYTAYVLFEGVAYQGCAKRGVDGGERPTWASVLPDLLPAIDTCLTRVTARPARVTTASMLDEGLVSVRLREADGGRRECVAAEDGSAVTVFDPVSDIDRRAGEGDPEFQRGGDQPAAEDCRSVEPALGRSGEALGWLIRRSC